MDIDPLDHTLGRNLLSIKLQRPIGANIVMVKLIDQENLMDELMDDHGYPNVDMGYVRIIGKKVLLPTGVADVKPV